MGLYYCEQLSLSPVKIVKLKGGKERIEGRSSSLENEERGQTQEGQSQHTESLSGVWNGLCFSLWHLK